MIISLWGGYCSPWLLLPLYWLSFVFEWAYRDTHKVMTSLAHRCNSMGTLFNTLVHVFMYYYYMCAALKWPVWFKVRDWALPIRGLFGGSRMGVKSGLCCPGGFRLYVQTMTMKPFSFPCVLC